MSTIETVPQPPGKVPLGYELADGSDPPAQPTDPRDSDEALKELRMVEDWYCEATDGLAECFAQIALDHDYYDHLQWSEHEKQEMLARGQAPLVFNKAAMTVDWITGTERRTRIDFTVNPKRKDGVDSAAVKSKLLKYQSDTNHVGWNRSQAFKDATIGGVGWMEASLRGDESQELVLHDYVPWPHMKWDPFQRKLDLDDCRYLHRRKWIDFEYGLAHFPGRDDILRQASRSHLFGEAEWELDNLDLPQQFRRYDSRGAEIVQRRWAGALPIVGSTHRLRVPTTETWFRQPRAVKRIWGNDLPGVRFDPNNQDHKNAVASGYASLSDAVTEDIRVCIWVPGGVLYRGVSPFKHGGFPFTPVWGKRRSRDGTPYGTMRGIRDAQDDYNKRRSKLLWLLSANQLLMEKSAVDPDRMQDVKRNLAKPGGVVEFEDGALSGERVRIERNIEVADAQAKLLDLDAAHIHDGSGVNREQLGRDTNATSGRAIIAKQQEGSVTTAELFDNLRLAVQLDGEKLLSLAEQYMTLPMQIRVTGDGPTATLDWIEINEPQLVDGAWQLKNDITKSDADFVVDQIDFRESVRQAQAEQFWDMLAKMPPNVQLGLLDLAVEMTDMPQREQIVARVRAMNGQQDPDEAKDPVAAAAHAAQQQAEQQQQQQEQELQLRERMAKAGLDEAKQKEILAKTSHLDLQSKAKALDIARLLEALLPLAPAADRLYPGPPQPVTPNLMTPATPAPPKFALPKPEFQPQTEIPNPEATNASQ
jgi:hypothetical protein